MGVLLFLFGIALAAGLYFVLADLLKIPRLATERALISAGRRERSLVKALEALILGWALKLAPLIRMDEYKYRRLESKLTAAGLDMTPQRGNGDEEAFKYRLSAEEQALLLPKMNTYCQEHWGQSLEECSADYLAEQSQELPEMQM